MACAASFHLVYYSLNRLAITFARVYIHRRVMDRMEWWVRLR